MKLNGWQRLWVVVSILWVIGVLTLVYNVYYSSHKSNAEVYRAWANESLEYLIAQVPELKGYTVSSLRNTYSDIADKDLIDTLHKKYVPKHPAYEYGLIEIDSKYDGKITSKTENIHFNFLAYILIALGFPACLYMLGWAIVWIRDGFKST